MIVGFLSSWFWFGEILPEGVTNTGLELQEINAKQIVLNRTVRQKPFL